MFRGETEFIREKPFQLRKGFYEAHLIPLFDQQNQITGGLCILHDITQRMEDERLIHEQNQELSATLEELASAEEQLRHTNEELERRVEQRTHELAASEEELRQSLDNLIELNTELESGKNFLNSIIEQSPLSTWIADSNGTMIQVNQACLDLFDITDPKHSIGHYNILRDEVLMHTPYYPAIEAVFREGKIAHFEVDYDIRDVKHVHYKTGQLLSLIGTVFPVKNADGLLTHAVVQHEDVTEKKKAEVALRQSEEQLRLITNALPVLISYIDTEKRYRFVNQAYADWFQRPKADIIGKKASEIVGDTAFQNVAPYLDRTLGGEAVKFETRQDYGSFGIRYISSNLIPHRQGEQVLGVYVLAHDISDRIEAEQTMEKLYQEANTRNEELKRINTDLDNFIYMASHDLKSPVANLEGLLNIMYREAELKNTNKEFKVLQMMELSVSKLKKTIEDLVEITKVQKGMDQPKYEEVCFHQVLNDILTDIQPLVEESQADIHMEAAVEGIMYPKSHVRSILYNLLSNALKYRSPDRKAIINITTYKSKDRVVLSVRDNGLGMTQVQQKKLFTMFKRMHTHVEGTGIGLYTIKRIIENNGGHIKVESKPDQGTAFLVYF